MRVLLTGGAGFIGSHTVEHLLKNTSWEIVVLDALTYAGDVSRLTQIEAFDPERVSIHWHDLRSPIGAPLSRRIGAIDFVINMASDSHVDRSIDAPVPFVLNNVSLVLHMLEWARERGVRKFIQVSTDEVYGPAPADCVSGEWDPHLPSNPYSASKAAQEDIAFAYWRTYGVPVIITNTMNNFGERQDPEKFVPRAISRIRAGLPVEIHSQRRPDGELVVGSRMWLHARNHADALLWILQHITPDSHPSAAHPTRFHIAGEEEIRNDEMALLIGKYLGVDPQLSYVDFHTSRPGHDLRYALESSELRRRGWRQPLDLHDSLERTVRWTLAHPEWLEAGGSPRAAPSAATVGEGDGVHA